MLLFSFVETFLLVCRYVSYEVYLTLIAIFASSVEIILLFATVYFLYF